MSMPPTGDQPPEQWPSHENPPVPPPPDPYAPGAPYPPGHPYGPPPGYGYGAAPGYPPPAAPPRRRISVGMMFVGPLIYVAVNVVLGFLAFVFAGSTTGGSPDAVFGFTALVLAVIAFGGGAALLALRSPYAKGIGLGLMIGWALTSVFTVGFCTGLNPGLYTL